MPKVLRIINRFNLGGPTYNVAYLSKYMAPEYETLLVGGAKDASEESSDFIVQQLGLKPVIIPEMRRSINPLNDYKAYRELKKIIREYRPDIVHTHASKAGTLGRLAAASCGVPVIVHTFHGHVFHSYFNKLTTTVFKIIERYLARKSSAIVAISEKQKQELTEEHHICAKEKISVIPLGFDLDRFRTDKEIKRKIFRSKWQIGDDELVISIIGRLVPVKNHTMFLHVISKVLKTAPDKKLRFLIVGDGECRAELELQAKQLEIPFAAAAGTFDPLIFTSWEKEVDVVLAGSDIVCLTSWNEGTPVSLIEAQAASVPIVSTRVGGIEDVVKEGETALLSPPGDIDAFEKQLQRLIQDDQLRKKFSVQGWLHASSLFHYTRLVSDMKSLYDRLLKKL
ncbi:MAG: glycosyltransferase family 4 protein [Bacteroidia bacterium]